MVKYIKIGRFAVAYDNTQPDDRSKTAAKVPPTPPPSPPPKAAVGGSGWATFGKFMLGLFGLFVVLLFIGSLAGPADQTEGDSAATASGGADPATPQGVCESANVQELVGKETRKLLLDPSREKLLMMALFGLIDPKETLDRFDSATVTFTGVRAGVATRDSVDCTGSMRFDDSNSNLGQDILQLPALAWRVAFADNDGDLTSSNFTVEVDNASLAPGMLINGKPAAEVFGEQDSTANDSTTPGDVDESGDNAAGIGQTDGRSAREDADSSADEAQAAADDAAKAEAQLDASDKPKPSRSPSDEDLYAPH